MRRRPSRLIPAHPVIDRIVLTEIIGVGGRREWKRGGATSRGGLTRGTSEEKVSAGASYGSEPWGYKWGGQPEVAERGGTGRKTEEGSRTLEAVEMGCRWETAATRSGQGGGQNERESTGEGRRDMFHEIV